MNQLTAYRTFGASSYTPARRVKIFDDRYYHVTMQNTERDQGDGYYLADGEYVELLPGAAARTRREARLNHCNAIREYRGPVYAVLTSSYGHWDTSRRPVYAASQSEAEMLVNEARAKHTAWINDCLKQSERYLAQAEAVRNGKHAIMNAEQFEQSARDAARVANENLNTFRFETLKVR